MGNENNNKINTTTKINSSQKTNKINSKNNLSKDDFQKQYKENNDFQTKKPTRFATVFQWDGDGTNVYLTGSFCDWQQFFEMEKCEDKINKNNNKFLLTLFLPKGAYQYKFKIDEQWKCNSNFPTCSDKNGNVNNVIDLTKQKKEDGTTDFSTSCITTGGQEAKLDSFQSLYNEFNNNGASDIKTEVKDYSDSSSIGYNYKIGFKELIPNKQINEMNNSQDEKEEINLYENSYKQMFPLRHEHFDHLCVNFNTDKSCTNNKNLIYSCSIRFGFKATTIIYYKPKIKKK